MKAISWPPPALPWGHACHARQPSLEMRWEQALAPCSQSSPSFSKFLPQFVSMKTWFSPSQWGCRLLREHFHLFPICRTQHCAWHTAHTQKTTGSCTNKQWEERGYFMCEETWQTQGALTGQRLRRQQQVGVRHPESTCLGSNPTFHLCTSRH